MNSGKCLLLKYARMRSNRRRSNMKKTRNDIVKKYLKQNLMRHGGMSNTKKAPHQRKTTRCSGSDDMLPMRARMTPMEASATCTHVTKTTYPQKEMHDVTTCVQVALTLRFKSLRLNLSIIQPKANKAITRRNDRE